MFQAALQFLYPGNLGSCFLTLPQASFESAHLRADLFSEDQPSPEIGYICALRRSRSSINNINRRKGQDYCQSNAAACSFRSPRSGSQLTPRWSALIVYSIIQMIFGIRNSSSYITRLVCRAMISFSD